MDNSKNIWSVERPFELLSHNHEDTTRVSDELWKSLLEKDKVLGMIWDIEDGYIRKTLENGLKYVSPEYILQEISIYYNEIEPRLEEYESEKLYNLCLKSKNMFPSQLSKEFAANETINQEQDLNVRELMDLSYGKKNPSEIVDDRDIYQEFASITDEDEKKIIKRCLSLYWLSASVVKEYQLSSYYEIKHINDENVRKMMLLCVNKWFIPSIVQDYQVYFENAAEYWEDNINRVLQDISKLKWNESYETIAYICSKNIYHKDVN